MEAISIARHSCIISQRHSYRSIANCQLVCLCIQNICRIRIGRSRRNWATVINVEVILVAIKKLETEDSRQIMHLLEASRQSADKFEALLDQLSREESVDDLMELLYWDLAICTFIISGHRTVLRISILISSLIEA